MRLTLKSRLLLGIGAVFSLVYLSLIYVDYSIARKEIFDSMLQQSRTIKELVASIRTVYTNEFVASGVPLTEKTVGLFPAHALGRISKTFGERVTWGISFNNVSDRARNPQQQADENELEAIRYFNENKDADEFMVIRADKNEKRFYHYTSPIWITKICLNCHGERASAPLAIRDKYDSAYNYEIGDLRGIISIKLSADILELAANKHLLTSAAIFLFGFLLTYLMVFYIFRTDVLNRLSVFSSAAKNIADGDYDNTITKDRDDEIGDVIDAFNHMSLVIADREHRFKDSHQRLKSIIDGSGEGILLSDKSGEILDVNKVACRIFDYDFSEMLGKPVSMLIPSEYLSRHDEAFIMAANSDSDSLNISPRSEFIGLRKGGIRFPIELTVTKTMHNGEPMFVAIMLDISDRKRADQELEITKQKYFHQEKIAAVGQLAAGILHEIGNPISAISGSVQYLKQLVGSTDEKNERDLRTECITYLDMVDQQTTRLTGITRDIANFVSPQREYQDIFDLNTLIESNSGLLRFDRLLKYITIDYQLDRDINAVTGIQDQIVQVFLNIMMNAGHACVESERNDKSITIKTGSSDGYSFLSVTDNGIGMDEETLLHAREAFFTTKEAGIGTGLGLSLCQSIIESHRGRLDISSKPGQGTVVSVYLPVAS